MKILTTSKVTLFETVDKSPAIEYPYQELGVEMQKHFKQNIWWLFYKYDMEDIRNAFEQCKKYNKCVLPYIISILKAHDRRTTGATVVQRLPREEQGHHERNQHRTQLVGTQGSHHYSQDRTLFSAQQGS